jgi:hypothetical protein
MKGSTPLSPKGLATMEESYSTGRKEARISRRERKEKKGDSNISGRASNQD